VFKWIFSSVLQKDIFAFRPAYPFFLSAYISLTYFFYFFSLQVDHTLPQAEEGMKLRIRQPFNRHLVSVVLGGSDLKVKKLDDTALNLPAAAASSLEDNETIASTPLKPRKMFEQHLRECAEKYAASEEGQRAAAARQDRLENTKAAAAEDQETAVNLSLNKDAASLTASAANRKGQNTTQTHRQKQSAILPAKRPLGAPLSYVAPPPAHRSRTVNFLSDEDFTTINQLQNTATDLSRFDSDSEEEENERNVKKHGSLVDVSRFDSDSEEEENGGGGRNGTLTRRTIPQVDGAADSEDRTTTTPRDSKSPTSDSTGESSSSESAEEESSDVECVVNSDSDDRNVTMNPVKKGENGKSVGTSTRLSNSSSSGEGTPSISANSSKTSQSSDAEDDEIKDEEKINSGKIFLQKEPPPDQKGDIGIKDSNGGGGGLQEKETAAAAWMEKYLPAGASFYRQDPIVQIEGAWRAGREASIREYKERRRQALRQAGKSGGGGNGGGGRQRKE
jgi:hypothetical protein